MMKLPLLLVLAFVASPVYGDATVEAWFQKNFQRSKLYYLPKKYFQEASVGGFKEARIVDKLVAIVKERDSEIAGFSILLLKQIAIHFAASRQKISDCILDVARSQSSKWQLLAIDSAFSFPEFSNWKEVGNLSGEFRFLLAYLHLLAEKCRSTEEEYISALLPYDHSPLARDYKVEAADKCFRKLTGLKAPSITSVGIVLFEEKYYSLAQQIFLAVCKHPDGLNPGEVETAEAYLRRFAK